jgi:hypothetical protein
MLPEIEVNSSHAKDCRVTASLSSQLDCHQAAGIKAYTLGALVALERLPELG